MSSTALKLTALFLMFCDHLHSFIPGIPVIFDRLGDLAAPVFIFCSVWSLHYTHDRKKYLLRLYGLSIIMGVGDYIISSIIGNDIVAVGLDVNIFPTLLLIGICVTLIELFLKKEWKKAFIWTTVFVISQYLLFTIESIPFICSLIPDPELILAQNPIPMWLANFMCNYGIMGLVTGILPSVFFTEGSFLLVSLGTILYFVKENKILLSLVVIGFGIIFFFTNGAKFDLDTLWYYGDWDAMLSLPLMLSFNHEKGKGYKYFFYFFYPIHIWLLFIIGNVFFR